MDMEQTTVSDFNAGPESARGDLTSLLLALWRNRVFVILVTVLTFLCFVGFSFTQRPVYSARVTILPQGNNSTADLFGPLASVIGSPLDVSGTYEQLYGQIVVSDRILDLAMEEAWGHKSFSKPVSLFEIFNVKKADGGPSAQDVHDLKEILRSEVISFTRKKTGFMVLTVNGPEDGEFAASLANYLVDQLDFFNANIKTNKANEQYAFLVGRLEETEKDLALAEDALTQFKINNRSYASSPVLLQRHGVLSREIQAQTSIWVELRKQLELAEIEKNKQNTSVDILDRASEPVVRAKPQRALFGIVGLFCGFLLALLLLIFKSQLAAVQRILKSCPVE